MSSSPVTPPVLEYRDIAKGFFGVPVLKGISFTLAAGEVLGLLGENGAGKSTLINILGGNLQPDHGTLSIAGQPYAPRGPQDAARRGIALIHQELNLFSNLTIAENIFLTRFPTISGTALIRRREVRANTSALLTRVGLELPPDTPLEKLSAGECQLVEIAKALSLSARVLVFDEPTTSLSHRECERLFALIDELRREGRAIIFISHNLDDALRLCDSIVVLRDGSLVGRGPARDFSAERLVTLMVGRELTQIFPTRTAAASNEPVLEVRQVSQPRIVDDITFTLHRGEVLGLAGLMGAGRSELARILFGLDPHRAGEIRCEGRPLTPSPRECIRRRVAFVTEDRRQDGLCLEASTLENMALVSLPRHARAITGWLDRSGLRQVLKRIAGEVRLSAKADPDQPVRTLSGGNQQKVVLARWLLSEPAVLILDEPTRGIDVGAKSEIYRLIHETAARGAGVLVISSELEELIGLCDRILVMNRGRICDEVTRAQFDRERILWAALHQSVAPPARRPVRP